MEVSEVKQVDNDSDINAADAAENYRIAGSRIECDSSKAVTWARFGHLYDPK